MKNILSGILFLTTLTFSACDKRETDDVSQVVKVTFPVVDLKGDPIVSVGVGTGKFTDPGATSFDSITSQKTDLVPIINTVDLTKPGFYSVEYKSKNQFGHASSATRLVLVTSVDPSVDFSGKWVRSNGVEVNIKKKGRGLYTIDNVGGVPNAPEYIFDVYIGQVSADKIEIPSQPNPIGGFVSCNVKSFSLTKIVYAVSGSGFGPADRTFTKK